MFLPKSKRPLNCEISEGSLVSFLLPRAASSNATVRRGSFPSIWPLLVLTMESPSKFLPCVSNLLLHVLCVIFGFLCVMFLILRVQVRDREIKVNIFDMAGHPFFYEVSQKKFTSFYLYCRFYVFFTLKLYLTMNQLQEKHVSEVKWNYVRGHGFYWAVMWEPVSRWCCWSRNIYTFPPRCLSGA